MISSVVESTPNLPMVYNTKIHTDYIYQLLALAEQHQLSPVKICNELDLELPRTEFTSITTLAEIARYMIEKHNMPDIGRQLGEHMAAGMHGYLGYATRSSLTVYDALRIDEQFVNTRITTITLKEHHCDQGCCFQILVNEDVGDLLPFILEFIIYSLNQFFLELFPQKKAQLVASVTYPQPDYVTDNTSEIQWQYSATSNSIKIPGSIAKLQLPSHDEILLKLSVQQCEQALELFKVKLKKLYSNITAELLSENLETPLTLPELAAQQGISERSFRRHLKLEGTSYREILRNLRLDRARELLGQTDLTIDAIAEIMGYESPNTFKRLFKEWTQVTPGQYRKSMR